VCIRIANDSKFGLGDIWTQNLDNANRLSSTVQSGIIPDPRVVVPDPSIIWKCKE